MKGYVPLRRGIFEHLKIMSFSELKVYIGLLVLASYKTASVDISLTRLGDELGLSYQTIILSVHRLTAFGYILYIPSKNQWKDSHFEILKYNASNKNTISKEEMPIKKVYEPTLEAGLEAPLEAGLEANAINSNNSKDLQIPKKVKEGKRRIKKVKEIVISKDITATNEIFNHFCFKYKEVFNKEYIASFAKDKRILKDLLVKIQIDNLKMLIDTFLTTPDQFCETAGYTIGVFKTRINSLRTDKLTLKVSDKTVKSMQAASNWANKGEIIDVKQN